MHGHRHPCPTYWFGRWDVQQQKSDHTWLLRVTLKRPVSLYQLCAHGLFLFAAALPEKGALVGEISLASPPGFGLHY